MNLKEDRKMEKFKKGTPGYGILIGLLFAAAGVLMLTIGFWKTILLAALFAVGYFIATVDDKSQFLKDTANSIIPKKEEKIIDFKSTVTKEQEQMIDRMSKAAGEKEETLVSAEPDTSDPAFPATEENPDENNAEETEEASEEIPADNKE